MIKGMISNTCYAIGDNNVSEKHASHKSSFTNTCHTIWNIDTSEGITFIKKRYYQYLSHYLE